MTPHDTKCYPIRLNVFKNKFTTFSLLSDQYIECCQTRNQNGDESCSGLQNRIWSTAEQMVWHDV